MKSKAKWFLLGGLVALLVCPLPGCGQGSRMSSQQVTYMIVNYAVPYIDHYYKESVGVEAYQASGGIGDVTPFGQWVPNYVGNGIWRVQGAVATKGFGNCLTTWTFDETTSDIRLIGFTCD